MAANPFYISHSELSKGLQGLGSTLKEARMAKEEQAKVAEAQDVFARGNPQEISAFMIANPEIGKRAAAGMQFANQITERNLLDSTKRVLAGEDPERVLMERIELVTQQGGDPSDSIEALQEYRTDPEGFMRGAENLFAIRDPQGHTAWRAATAGPKPTAMQMGTGDMAGYVFNPDTGGFSIDPEIKAELQRKADAERAAAQAKSGEVDAKTRSAINKDVTALTKDAVGIYKSAQDLTALEKNASAASKLAAVFKFMKALDPTSVVRESEQGQVYSAQGAAANLAGMINGLMGEGQLTEAGFRDIAATAKVLADSAVKSSAKEMTDYLDTYEETLPDSFKSRLMSRVPEVYTIGQVIDVNGNKYRVTGGDLRADPELEPIQ